MLKRQHIGDLLVPFLNMAVVFGIPKAWFFNKKSRKQNRAARFVTSNYSFEIGSMTGILENLKWESLKKRRKDSRLILLYKGLKGAACIPTDDLIPPIRRNRNRHSLTFQTPATRAHSSLKQSEIGMSFQIRSLPLLKNITSAEEAEDGVAAS